MTPSPKEESAQMGAASRKNEGRGRVLRRVIRRGVGGAVEAIEDEVVMTERRDAWERGMFVVGRWMGCGLEEGCEGIHEQESREGGGRGGQPKRDGPYGGVAVLWTFSFAVLLPTKMVTVTRWWLA